jgi:hypothetical protein
MHRHRLTRLFTVEHRQCEIDVRSATWRIEHAAGARPIFDRLRAIGGLALLDRLNSRVQPSTRSLGLAMRPSESRTHEPSPSAPTIRSGLSRWPLVSASSPAAVAAVAAEPVTISTPALAAATASALIMFWRTMLNARLPFQRCTETTRLRSSRTSPPLEPPAAQYVDQQTYRMPGVGARETAAAMGRRPVDEPTISSPADVGYI